MNMVATLISSCIVLLLLGCAAGVIKGLFQGGKRQTWEFIREIFQCFLICLPLSFCIVVIMRQHALAISICCVAITLSILLCTAVLRILVVFRVAYNKKRAMEKIIPEVAA